jgi:type IV secretory pathway VirB3-like protein
MFVLNCCARVATSAAVSMSSRELVSSCSTELCRWAESAAFSAISCLLWAVVSISVWRKPKIFVSPLTFARSRAIGRNSSVDKSGSMSETRPSIERIERCASFLNSASSRASLVVDARRAVSNVMLKSRLICSSGNNARIA